MTKFETIYEGFKSGLNESWNIDGIVTSVIKDMKDDGYKTPEEMEDVIDDYIRDVGNSLYSKTGDRVKNKQTLEKIKDKILDKI